MFSNNVLPLSISNPKVLIIVHGRGFSRQVGGTFPVCLQDVFTVFSIIAGLNLVSRICVAQSVCVSLAVQRRLCCPPAMAFMALHDGRLRHLKAGCHQSKGPRAEGGGLCAICENEAELHL